MVYQEKKKKQGHFNWEYKCEDLFGWATIRSEKKLTGEILDQLVIDIIMAKQLKKGHTEDHKIEFDAKFKKQWEDVEEDIEIKQEKTKEGWFKRLLSKIKKI